MPDRESLFDDLPEWNGRRVFDADSGTYLGRAVGEPWSDGIEGYITLRQDEDGQTIRPYMCCGFVVLDSPPEGTPLV